MGSPKRGIKAGRFCRRFLYRCEPCDFYLVHFGGRWTGSLRKIVIGAIGIADILAPPLVWSAHGNERRLLLILAKPIPVLLICAVPLLPWLMNPLPYNVSGEYGPPVKVIENGVYYQVIKDTENGEIVALDDLNNRLTRFNPDHPDIKKEMPLQSRTTQVMVFDPVSRKLIYLAPENGKAYVHDFDSLDLLYSIPWNSRSRKWRPG